MTFHTMDPVVLITWGAPAAQPLHNPAGLTKKVEFMFGTFLKNLCSKISILGVFELIYYKKSQYFRYYINDFLQGMGLTKISNYMSQYFFAIIFCCLR